MELGQVPMAPALSEALARASSIAVATRFGEMSLEHLLYALCDDSDAIAVFEASRVDYARLKMETAAYLSSLEPRADAQDQPLAISSDVSRILDAAYAAARGGRRHDINGAIVLAAIVGDGRSYAAQLLHSQGLTFDEAIRALQRALAPPAQLRDAPPIAPADDVLARARERVQSRSAPSFREMRSGSAPAAQRSNNESEASPKFEPYFDAHAPETPISETQPPAQDEGQNLDAPRPDPALPFPASDKDAPLLGDMRFEEGAFSIQHPVAAPEGGKLIFRQFDDASPYAPKPTEGPSQAAISFEIPRPIPIQPPPIPRASPTGAPMPPDGSPPTSPHAPWPDSFASPSGFEPVGRGREPAFEDPPAVAFPAPDDAAITPFDPVPSLSPRSATEPRERGAATALGQLAENIPRSMRTGATERVEIRIAKASIQDLAEGLEGGGAAWRHNVIITKAMSVRLRAPEGGFFIETASPETQWIENQLGLTGDDFASWRFLVTPQTRGRARLQIIISARTVGADGFAAETALPDQTIDVHVRANYGRAAKRWAGWTLAAIVGGALAKFGEAGIDAYVARFLN